MGPLRLGLGWGARYFSAMLDRSSWSISGSVWVLWKQLGETAGRLKENV